VLVSPGGTLALRGAGLTRQADQPAPVHQILSYDGLARHRVLDHIGYQRPRLLIAVSSVLAVSALGVYGGYRVLLPMAVKPPKV
jgi:hypothetical protein